jgi:Tfp pilus assembly protein FimT
MLKMVNNQDLGRGPIRGAGRDAGPGVAAGFTLVENTIVMAISTLLLMMVFAGQQQLRARAQFDADVNKLVAMVSDAHNQATAGVNIIGGGDGSSSCAAGPAGQYVFAGTAWTISNTAPSFVTMDYYKALPGSVACKFSSQSSNFSNLEITQINGVGGSAARLLFVRTDTGGLVICAINNAGVNNELQSFRLGACSGGPAEGNLTIRVRDKNNPTNPATADILIDKSGLAKRNN